MCMQFWSFLGGYLPLDPYISKTMGQICMKFTILTASLICSVITLLELLPSVWFLKRRFLNLNFPKNALS